MAVPELVGTTLIRPSALWASSYTITTADLPADTRIGDRVILWLLGSGSGTTGANHPRGVWGLPAVWRDWLAGAQKPNLLFSGYMSKNATWVNVYSSRYLPDTFPVTISPTLADETSAPAGTFWQGVITVYRPSKEPDGLGQISSFNADSAMPGSPPNAQNFPPYFADGIAVGVGHFASGTSTGIALTTANGYTERFIDQGVIGRAVMIHIDKPGGSGSFGVPVISKTVSSSAYGVTLFVSLGDAPDTPSYADEWGVGTIRF